MIYISTSSYFMKHEMSAIPTKQSSIILLFVKTSTFTVTSRTAGQTQTTRFYSNVRINRFSVGQDSIVLRKEGWESGNGKGKLTIEFSPTQSSKKLDLSPDSWVQKQKALKGQIWGEGGHRAGTEDWGRRVGKVDVRHCTANDWLLF